MPLDAQAELCVRSLDRLDDTIGRGGADRQVRRDVSNRLVVTAVDRQTLGRAASGVKGMRQFRRGDDVYEVGERVLGGVDRVVQWRLDLSRDVLDERAAGSDVQHLHPAADGEERQVGVHRTPRQIDLELVAPGFGIVDRRVALLLVEHRVHVPSAGEQHAVDFGQNGTGALGHFENARGRARGFESRRCSRPAGCSGVTPMMGFISSYQTSAISSQSSQFLVLSSESSTGD